MIELTYTVIYPRVNRSNPTNDPHIASQSIQRSFRHFIELPNDSIPRETVCEAIFGGMNAGSGQEFPWFLGAKVRSMSVGDVINFENSDVYYIVDSVGYLTVNKAVADSWLGFSRQYGCDMFELNEFKRVANISRPNTLS